MRRDGRDDQRVAFPLVRELLDVLHAFVPGFIVGRGKIEQRLAEHGTHSGFRRLFGNGVLEVIHIHERRRAAFDHLQTAELGPPAHKLFIDVFGFSRKDVFLQPLHQHEVVGDAAKQDHRHMRVGVDESRHDDARSRIDDALGFVL